jgi:hypothetical protein
MNGLRILGLIMMIAGALALVYGGFSYTKDSTAAKLGPIELSVKEKKKVEIPLWASVGVLVLGGVLLGASRGKR